MPAATPQPHFTDQERAGSLSVVPQAACRHAVESGFQTDANPELGLAAGKDTFHCGLSGENANRTPSQLVTDPFPKSQLLEMRTSDACLTPDSLCSQVVVLEVKLRILTAWQPASQHDLTHPGAESCPGKHSTLCHFKYTREIYIRFEGCTTNFVEATPSPEIN